MAGDIDKTMGNLPTMKNRGGDEINSMVTMRSQSDHVGNGRFKPGGLILGRYRVLSELGQGGMGVVYKCFDEVSGVEIALKALPPELSHNSLEMEDIKDNFHLVSKLVHQNIAVSKTLERDAATGDYYLIMECVEGENLRTWIRRKQRERSLTVNDVLPVVRQIAVALDYAHNARVIHRDIKPGNVMISPDGNIKVLDFGLAAQIHTSMTRVSMAYHGTSGTGPYMAPEQWRGRRQDATADQYALAVMVYEMLAGCLPFESADAAVLRQAVLSDTPEPIKGVTGVVWKAVCRAMAKEPTERFASCGDFAAALSGKKVRGAAKSDSGFFMWIIVAAMVALMTGGGFFVYNHIEQPIEGKAQPEDPIVAEEKRQAEEEVDAAAEEEAHIAKAAEEAEKCIAAEEKRQAEEEVDAAAEEEAHIAKAAEEAEKCIVAEEKRQAEEEARTKVSDDLKPAKPVVETNVMFNGVIDLGGDVTLVLVNVEKGECVCNGGNITLSMDFWIGKYEITQEQYQQIMGNNPSGFSPTGSSKDRVVGKDTRRFPVENVSWEDAKQFCEVLNGRNLVHGFKFRLPTEAEWEYASRGGMKSKGYECSGSDEADKVAWYYGNSGRSQLKDGWNTNNYASNNCRSHEVGTKGPNELGLHDMSGNVWEWCEDWDGGDRVAYTGVDPKGPSSGLFRVCRGGSWEDSSEYCCSARRYRLSPGIRNDRLGFRVVLVPIENDRE